MPNECKTSKTVQLKNGEIGLIRILDANDVDPAFQLQTIISQHLNDNEKTFILEKTKEDFSEALNNKNHVMIGIFVNEQLIAQQILNFNGTDYHVPFHSKIIPLSDQHAELGGALVHPDYRGNHLTSTMCLVLEEIAQEKGIQYLTLEIHAANPYSYRAFLENGFFIAHAVKSPFDNEPVLLLFKHIQHPMVYQTNGQIKITHHEMNIKRTKALIAGGYCGQQAIYDRKEKIFTLFFAKPLTTQSKTPALTSGVIYGNSVSL